MRQSEHPSASQLAGRGSRVALSAILPAASLAALLLLAPAVAVAIQPPALAWQLRDSGTDVSLRGLSAVSERVVWATGSNGTWLRTIDGGTTWQHGQIPGAETLGIRDIHAFDELEAVALTIASPGRVYRTHDGGYSWQMVFEDDRPEVFFNCMDFADGKRGYAVGDPVDGRFLFIETLDGGKNWAPLSAPSRPEADGREAQFAASGTCLQAEADALWIGTGGSVARVFQSTNRGRAWKTSATTLQQGAPSKGVFGLLFWDRDQGIIVGGDYTREDDASGSVAFTGDGGATWSADGYGAPNGFRSAVVRVGHDGADLLITVGPNGSDISRDGGLSWTAIPGPGFHTLSVASDGAVWAAGADGRIAELVWR